MCEVPDCRKLYCTGCITVLVGAECVELIQNKSKWKCYLCSDEHEQSYGLLEKKSDWPGNVIRMYQPDECYQVILFMLQATCGVEETQIVVFRGTFHGIPNLHQIQAKIWEIRIGNKGI